MNMKSRICFSADLTNIPILVKIIDDIGPYIGMVKLHLDIFYGEELKTIISCIQALKRKHKFYILVDRKLGDIGSTVLKQIENILKILPETDFITAFPWVKIPDHIDLKIGLFYVVNMSSHSLFSKIEPELVENIRNNKYMAGIITQKLIDLPVPHLVPGVSIRHSNDHLDQKYRDIDQLLFADILIIGRDIYLSNDPILYCKQVNEKISSKL